MSKTRKCRIKAEGCEVAYTPFNSLQKCCLNPKCVLEFYRKQEKKKRLREAKREREEHRQAKERLKTKSDWLREAQTAFNKWIRLRDIKAFQDAGDEVVCISCQKPPKKMNAGHYLSVGAHPELRFEPLNNNLQCEHCNSYKSGNQINYRKHLITKIGLTKVEWLEGPHPAKKYSIEDIKEIKSKYSKLARELEKELSQ